MSAFDDSGIMPKEYESNEVKKANGVIIKRKNISKHTLKNSMGRIIALLFSIISLVLGCLVTVFFHFSKLMIIYAGGSRGRILLVAASLLIGVSSMISVFIESTELVNGANKIVKYSMIITWLSLVLFILNLILRVFFKLS